MSEQFNWNTATQATIYKHKNENYDATKKVVAILEKIQPDGISIVKPYISIEDDIYVAGGVLYIVKDKIGFMSNHLTMKHNINIVMYTDEILYETRTKKEFILNKLKSSDLDLTSGREVIQEYEVTPELTDEQELDLATGMVPSNHFNDTVNVYKSEFFGIEILVHMIGTKIYFIEELPDEEETKDEQLVEEEL